MFWCLVSSSSAVEGLRNVVKATPPSTPHLLRTPAGPARATEAPPDTSRTSKNEVSQPSLQTDVPKARKCCLQDPSKSRFRVIVLVKTIVPHMFEKASLGGVQDPPTSPCFGTQVCYYTYFGGSWCPFWVPSPCTFVAAPSYLGTWSALPWHISL